jgi:hypothetical protein
MGAAMNSVFKILREYKLPVTITAKEENERGNP